MQPLILSRRALLRIAGAAACGACGSSSAAPGACATDGTGPGLGYCLVENKKLRLVGGARIAVGQAAIGVLDDGTACIVVRDANGLYALSATCSHACCTVNVCVDPACATPATTPGPCAAATPLTLPSSGAAFLCPCHGSEYAADGSLLRGPATRSLPSVALAVDGDDVVVDMSTAASAAARV